jgi:integrase
MGVSLTLKHIKELGAGRYEYRRRVPDSAKVALGKSEFKRVFTASSPASLAREHARITAEFDKAVADAQRKLQDRSKLTKRETAEVAQEEAARLLEGVHGAADEEDARDILAHVLELQGASPALYRAVVLPDEVLPSATLEDARKLYVREKLRGGEGADVRAEKARVDRVFGRVAEAVGAAYLARPLNKLVREEARKVREYLLRLPRNGGGTLAPSTVRRELKTLSAVINYGLTEFDLGHIKSPFDDLHVDGGCDDADRTPDAYLRDSLPKAVADATRDKLKGDLRLIWRLLAGTGCRLGEVRGLRPEDVNLTHAIPHLRIVPHARRRLKTKASRRNVPLLGDALEAAKEAVAEAEGLLDLFPRFAKPRGTDNCSTQLMSRLRKVTTNPKHVVHSLRHSMKDALRLAGVTKAAQDLVLGHAATSIGEAYGGEEGRLQEAYRALNAVVEMEAEKANRSPGQGLG